METTLVKAGDIVLLNLEPAKGGEKGKTRPCVVLVGSGHPWGIVIVVPITEGSLPRSAKLFVPVPATKETGLSKISVVDTFQVRCVSETRVVKKLGAAPSHTLDDIRSRLAAILDIGEEHVNR